MDYNKDNINKYDDNNNNDKRYAQGRKASHNNFLSEPHSPHFLGRATSESLSFD